MSFLRNSTRITGRFGPYKIIVEHNRFNDGFMGNPVFQELGRQLGQGLIQIAISEIAYRLEERQHRLHSKDHNAVDADFQEVDVSDKDIAKSEMHILP